MVLLFPRSHVLDSTSGEGPPTASVVLAPGALDADFGHLVTLLSPFPFANPLFLLLTIHHAPSASAGRSQPVLHQGCDLGK